jgi:hypothetical protein
MILEGSAGSNDLDGFDFFSFDTSNNLRNKKGNKFKQHAIRQDVLLSRSGLPSSILENYLEIDIDAEVSSPVVNGVVIDEILDEVIDDGDNEDTVLLAASQRKRSLPQKPTGGKKRVEKSVGREEGEELRPTERSTSREMSSQTTPRTTSSSKTTTKPPVTTTPPLATTSKMLDNGDTSNLVIAGASIGAFLVLALAIAAIACVCSNKRSKNANSGCDLMGNSTTNTGGPSAQDSRHGTRRGPRQQQPHSVVMNYLRENHRS